MCGKLYMIPVWLGENDINDTIPANVVKRINSIVFFIAENIRTSRRYLSKMGVEKPIRELQFFELNKHTPTQDLRAFLKPALAGEDMGLMSEAGCPGVADPGAIIVDMAHKLKIQVVPLTGPSSILLALMASGMNGQSFSFNGYLPIKKHERIRKIKHIEAKSRKENQTQIFIETPYRNMVMIEDVLATCHQQTQFCIAVDITLPTEYIKTQTVGEWKKKIPQIHKQPATFLLHAGKIFS